MDIELAAIILEASNDIPNGSHKADMDLE